MKEASSLSWWYDLLLLTLLLIALFSALLGSRHLAVPDEARYAEIPREMVANNNYITPTLNDIKYFQKPPLFYWLQAGVIQTFGLNEWAVRLPNALFALLGCLLTYITARKYYGRRCGWLASIILATAALYFVMAHFVTLDMTVSVLLMGCLFSFMLGIREPPGWQRMTYFWSLYGCAALAVLTKGLIGILFPGLIIFIWLCLTNRWRNLKTCYLPSGIILFLLIALPWHIAVQLKNPEFFDYYFIDQQFRRYLTNYAGREQPLWYLPFFLLGGFAPWTVFLPQAICHHLSSGWRQLRQHGDTLLLLLWSVIIYLFFQISHSQLPPYILPVFPPCAILLARYFDNAWQKPAQRGITWGFIIILLLAVAAAVGIFALVSIAATAFGLPPAIHNVAIQLKLGSIVLILVILLALKMYSRQQPAPAFILLAAATALFLTLAFSVFYPQVDTKTIRPLALQINAQYQPGDKIVAYHSYYQDLPFYTRQRVVIVNWNGEELAFGMQHQDMRDWLLDDAAFWQLWHSPQRVFVVLSQQDFSTLNRKLLSSYYRLGETTRNVLLVNHPINGNTSHE